jgi:acyl-CoA synthetase (NDP forming)
VDGLHFYTARFSETGRKDAIELEKEALRRAKNAGICIIGPNCMGVYYPAWGMSWNPVMSREPGSLGLISQSGAAAFELIESARIRGMHFSKGISYGNAIDFNECDYLEYFAQDMETKLIIMYIEGVRDGKRFLDVLRKTTSRKPVIILKGGRGKSGTRATASHTASLAGSKEIWETAMKQAGVISVVDMDELLDVASAFYFLSPVFNNRVGVAGASGGGSVMAADLCEEAGLDVIPLPNEIREELRRQGNPIWDWISNPADFSIAMGDFDTGAITKMMAAHPDFDLNIVFMTPPGLFGPRRNQPPTTIDTYLKGFPLDDLNGKPLLVVLLDGGRSGTDFTGEANKILDELRNKLIERHIPTYPSIARAANAAAKMVKYYKKQKADLTTYGS